MARLPVRQILTAHGRGNFARASGPQIQLSNASFTAGSAQGTAIGTLSVTGGTGTYTFTLTDSHTNAVQVAGTNGVNLQAGAASSGAGSFNITVHADNGTGSTFDRVFSIAATAAPANTVAPSISGSAVQGATLTASSGTWTGYPVPTLTYQWKRAGVAITGATGTTYVVQNADVGSAITVTVTGTNGIGSPAVATSSATATVTKTTLSYTPVTTATNGSAYTGTTPSTSGGTAAYTYTISAGTLPAGTLLDTSTGIISGTPNTTATYSGIVLTVTDANGVTDSSSPFTITVSAVVVGPAAPVLTWTSGPTVASPTFSASIDNYVVAGDTFTLQVQTAGGNWSAPVINSTHTITGAEDAANTVTITASALTSGSYEARAKVNHITDSPWSNTATQTLTLSSAWLLEDASGDWTLEDASGHWILEA